MSLGATKKLYDEDSYLKEFTALVKSCNKSGDFFKIELNQTAFFPEGGGQLADPGFFIVNGKGIKVFDVQLEGDKVFHFTREKILENFEISGVIDFEERFRRMQNHTGEHIVSGLINRTFGYNNIGFHLGDDDTTCDYDGVLSWNQVKEIEKAANEAVFANKEVVAYYPDPVTLPSLEYRSKLDLTEGVRLVMIDGVDCCACCAPHVKTTAEVGLIKIVNIEKSHGGTRLHLRCGMSALLDYDEKQTQALRIGDLLSARQFELADCVEALQKANSRLNYELARMSEKVAEATLTSLEKVDGNKVMVLSNADTDALRAFANGGRKKVSGLFVALTEAGTGFRYMITSADDSIKLSAKAKEFNDALLGRGGGKDDMIQGTFAAPLEEIEKYFDNK